MHLYAQVWVRAFDGNGLRQLSLGQTLSEADVRDGDKLELVQANWQASNPANWQANPSRKHFHIPVRAYPEPLVVEDEIVIPLPLKKPQQQGALVRTLQTLLPILGTASGSLFFLFYVINDKSNPLLLVVALAMPLIGILTSFITTWTQSKMLKESQKRAREAYQDHLDILSKKLYEKVNQQRKHLRQLFPPDQEDLVKMAHQGSQLWVRGTDEADFLQVSLGSGKVDFYQLVSLQARKDYLAEYEKEDLQKQEDLLKKVNNLLIQEPVRLDLRAFGVLTLVGERTHTRGFVRALLSQMVVFHSPQNLRCLVYFPSEVKDEWKWLKWLPHTRLLRASDGEEEAKEPFALLASQVEELRWLLEKQVKPALEPRRNWREGKLAQAPSQSWPHLFVLIDGFTLDGELGKLLTETSMAALLREAVKLGMTVLYLVDHLSNEPVQTEARITWTGSQNGTLTFQEIKQDGRREVGITPRSTSVDACKKIALSLAALKLAGMEHAADLLRNIRLLDLLQVPPDADMIRRLRERSLTRPDDLLNVPVGKNEQGKPVYLDLKEAAEKGDGPHGLLVGMTGSGKSELLLTLILALAIQHDTLTLNFVFIDFKGGASFAKLTRLPHKAGLITNLENEPGLFDRMVASLSGEVKRRQDLFNLAGAKNIQEYRQWRSEKQLVALPHLLLVVDETAELLTGPQGQAFRELFISVGRVGRSLGIHLLLATQKIEGNAFHGLESSLRYRLCLRTSTTDESIAVLGRPDAFYLPSTPGIGYLKVDDRAPQMMKAALVSQPVTSPLQGDLARRIRTFTSTGHLAPISGLSTTTQASSTPVEEIQAIIGLLLELSRGVPRAHPVWQEPLPTALGLRGLEKWLGSDPGHSSPLWQMPGDLRISVGLVDLPQKQRQEPLTLDFASGDGHLVLIGAPQSGKSTFLRSLLMALMLTHSPGEVQIYVMDLAGGQFHKYQGLPHIGAVCRLGQVEDLRLTLRLMHHVIAERQDLFQRENFDTMAEFRRRRQRGQYTDFAYGDVFLVIDTMAPFRQEYEALGNEIAYLLQHGPNAGVHLILTANDWHSIRSTLLGHISTYLELRLNVPGDSHIDPRKAAELPGNAPGSDFAKDVPGRGLTGDKALFQTSLPWIDRFPSPTGKQEETTLNYLKSQANRWSGPRARDLPKLPFPIKLQEMREIGGYGLLLGLKDFTLEGYYLNLFEEGPHFQVWGDPKCGKTTLLKVCLEELQSRYPAPYLKIGVIESGSVGQPPLWQSVKTSYYLTNAWIKNLDSLKKSIRILKEHLQPRLLIDPNQAARESVQTHYVLLVDGYDPNLVKDQHNTMRDVAEWAELVEWTERGEEIGFHIILTGLYNVATNTRDNIIKALMVKTASPGLLLNASTSPGKVLYDQSPAAQPHPGRGFIVRPGQGRTIIQVALPTEATSNQQY